MGRTLGRAVTLAAGLAAVAAASPPSADALTCTASSSVPLLLRAEGLSEPVGDIVINCQSQAGDAPTANNVTIQPVNVTVFLNTNLSSRVLAPSVGGTAPFFSEALLILDEAGSGSVPLAPCQTASGVCQNKGNGTGSGYYVGQPGSNGNVNVFQGTGNPAAAPNQLTFSQVPLDPPSGSGSRVLRITNIRANANALAPGGIIPSQVVAFVSMPALANPQQTLGFVQAGHTATLRDAASSTEQSGPAQLRTCDQTTNVRLGTLRFSENFSTSFLKRNPGSTLPPAFTQNTATPGILSNTETMFFSSSLVGHPDRGNLGLAGLPDAGTRLVARFAGVPPGVRLFVDTQATAVGAAAQGAHLTPGETDGFSELPVSAGGPPGAAEVPLTGGSGTAVWEITSAAANASGALEMGVYTSYPAGIPSPGTATVAMGLGPGMDAAVDNRASPGPVPRFDGGDVTQAQLLQVIACPAPATPGTATLSELRISPRKFRAAPRGGSIVRPAAVGTRVSYRVSLAARVRFRVERSRPGRRVGGRCVAPTRSNRAAPRCRRFVRLRGSFEHAGQAGQNAFRFSGRLRGRRLLPGRYRLRAAPVLAGSRLGALVRAPFRIVKR